jgi:hypothetical protein
MELFSLRNICRICPQHRGPGPPTPAHGSTNFIKRRSLASGSTAQIDPSKPLSRLLISAIHHRSDGWDGWLRPGAAPAHAFSRATMVDFRWGLLLCDHSDEGNVFMLTLIDEEQQRSAARVRWLGRCLSTVRVASGEASAPRTCAKASSSSLLPSRLTNCSDRQQKTQIWCLPRVRWVLDLQPKIHTIRDAIYMGFLIGS